ncbi:GNAT family N-acetyltransferase [Demequina sp. NBRC 110053]|uniref:GNAT family N-acetyltransferase n=1 Tax=Demequina sp. NBRC 110053 TaxID=1570342 RepID=UPI000A016EAC|nr:GNAT family N-acetyltransferase [Demequina sp. NBRC 110053]
MTASWLPADFEHPLHVSLGDGVHLRPISADDLEIDMPAVMGNQPALWAKYGEAWGWPPADMSAEADREDLDRHAREMVTHESFNYAILPASEEALYGCVYIDPAEGDGADALAGPAADVSFWVTADAPAGLGARVTEFVPEWFAREWPFATVRYPFGEVG